MAGCRPQVGAAVAGAQWSVAAVGVSAARARGALFAGASQLLPSPHRGWCERAWEGPCSNRRREREACFPCFLGFRR